MGGVEAMVHFENGRSQLGSFGKTPEKGSGLTVGEDRYLVWRVETRPPNPLQVWVEKDRSRSGEAAVREAATARVTDADRPRYMLHYSDRDGRDRGGVMRSFDEPLHEGREFAGVGRRDEFSQVVGDRNRFDRPARHFRRRDRSAVLRVAFVREHREPGVIRGCGLRELRQRRRSLRQPFRWRIQWCRRCAERLHKRRSLGPDLRAER